MTLPYQSAQDYLEALRALADARDALSLGLISDEDYREAERMADRAGSGWEAGCAALDKRTGGWEGK